MRPKNHDEIELNLRILAELMVIEELLCELVSRVVPASDDSNYARELENTKATYRQSAQDIYGDLKRKLEKDAQSGRSRGKRRSAAP